MCSSCAWVRLPGPPTRSWASTKSTIRPCGSALKRHPGHDGEQVAKRRSLREDDLVEVLSTFQGMCIQTVPSFRRSGLTDAGSMNSAAKASRSNCPNVRYVFTRFRCNFSVAGGRNGGLLLQRHIYQAACLRHRRKARERGHLSALRRTSVGPFTLDGRSGWIEDLLAAAAEGLLIPLNDALSHLPAASMSDGRAFGDAAKWATRSRMGRKTERHFCACPSAVRIVTDTDRLAALWWPTPLGGPRRLRVFPC